MNRNRSPVRALAWIALAALPLLGCDKIKAAMGQLDDGGTSAADGAANATGLNILSGGFEGEIDLLIKGKATKANQPVNLALDVKGDKIRGDVPQGIDGADKLGKASGIYNAPEKKMYVVLDAQKKVIVIDLNKSGEQLKAMTPPSAPGAASPPSQPATPPTISKTGKSDTVAGYTCEIWEITSHDPKEKGKSQVCVAQQQGVSFFHIPMTGVPAEYAAMSELADGNHFPLRLVAFDESSVEQMRIEVTKIEKKTLDASLFEPPAGYQQVDLAQMFSGMSGGRAGGRPGMPGMPGAPPHHGPSGH